MNDQGGEMYELDEALFMIGQLYYRERMKNAEIRRLRQMNEDISFNYQQVVSELQRVKNKEGGDDN